VFLDHLREHGITNAHLLIPGSTVELHRDRTDAPITHPYPIEDVERIHVDKRGYLEDYAARWKDRIAAEKEAWAHPGPTPEPLQPALAAWFEPLMDTAQHLCARLGDRVLLDLGTERIVLDFPNRRVVADDGGDYRYTFVIDDALVRTCVRERFDDWVNALFLSCRFRASRKGPYNEHVYTWFKSLAPEKARYVEDWLTEEREVTEMWRFGDRLVQRRCPHLSADLARFGQVEDGVLTCGQHGWKFDLEPASASPATTSPSTPLPSRPARRVGQPETQELRSLPWEDESPPAGDLRGPDDDPWMRACRNRRLPTRAAPTRRSSATSASSPTSTTASRRWPTACCRSPASSTSGSCARSTSTGWTSSASAASPSRARRCGCRGSPTTGARTSST
jgi:UDP-MurNAc hydroxylase